MKQEKDHEAGGHTDLAERRRLKMRRRLKQTVCLLLALLLTAGTLPASVLAYSDPREQAHGISYIQTPSGRYLIWSDQYGRKSANGSWTHDIYALPVTKAGLRNPEANKQTLVSAHEAQEPASASVAGDGSVFLTFEDGNATTYRGHDYTLAQRYAIFSSSLRPEVPYDPQKNGAVTPVTARAQKNIISSSTLKAGWTAARITAWEPATTSGYPPSPPTAGANGQQRSPSERSTVTGGR